MKLAIIADDLTGANDAGVQWVNRGLRTVVLLQPGQRGPSDEDAFVIDTDSRSVDGEEAYRRVREAARFLSVSYAPDIVYKKMDSTMRGNVGAEIDATYDVFRPEFVVIAPAFPRNGRQVIDGRLYLEGRLLHETETARDPKTPVRESDVRKLLSRQTKRPVAHVALTDLLDGGPRLKNRLAELVRQRIPYVLFDAAQEEHLAQIVRLVTESGYRVVWAGSAGLARHLPVAGREVSGTLRIPRSARPVLLVVGSVSGKSRRQLELVLRQPGVARIRLAAERVVTDEETRKQELHRVLQEAEQVGEAGRPIVLYSSGEPADIEKANASGRTFGRDAREVSDLVAEALGFVASECVRRRRTDRLVLTGGDTARHTFVQLQATEFRLLGEVEPGIPIGQLKGALKGSGDLYAVTKAGSFGSEQALLKAIDAWKEGDFA